MLTHGMKGTKEYNIWKGIKQRCLNKNNKGYHSYGGRGINICPEWEKSFEIFYEDMGERPKGKTLDRIDNNRGYYKENCRWATKIEQSNNRRNTFVIEFKGEKKSLAEWARMLKISRKTLTSRLTESKWTIKMAFETPVNKNKSRVNN